MKLIIGNKNYSTWSLRPWLAMTVAGIPFEEQVVPFGSDDFKRVVPGMSGTGLVPLLIDGDIRVWESLAILEYLAEKFPDAGLWPRDVAARAYARAIANEMHASFRALRADMPMNIARKVMKRELSEPVAREVRRVDAIWAECRQRYGQGGPFLFGARFTNADAMYAPVASRFRTYAVDLSPESGAYRDAVLALPAYQAWATAGLAEPWLVEEDEVDWPTVHRA